MIIRNASGPSRCKQCLLDIDEAVRMHLGENNPCSRPGQIIGAALEHRRHPPIIIGTVTVRKPPGIVFGKAYSISPVAIAGNDRIELCSFCLNQC